MWVKISKGDAKNGIGLGNVPLYSDFDHGMIVYYEEDEDGFANSKRVKVRCTKCNELILRTEN